MSQFPHHTAGYLLNPQHKITVSLIGLGGTGSHVLTALGKMNAALKGIGHPGLHVYAYDGDTVSETNVGRQMFSPTDIGLNKAIVLITRINRFFGYEWEATDDDYGFTTGHTSNITISCVDSAAARVLIGNVLGKTSSREPTNTPYYWMDFGNELKTGQVVLGTIGHMNGPGVKYNALPTVLQLFPQLKKMKDKNTGPSCSISQALGRQDLFVNSTLANLGMNILWKLFREAKLSIHGQYMNLETGCVNPIRVK